MAVAKRRTVLLGAGAAGVSAAVAACGSDGGDTAVPEETTSAPPAESPTQESGALASLSDVPEGGGIVLGAQKVVLTQPTKGEIKGFSATCTHKGCKLASVKDGTINCDCHGSKFDMADGSVKHGPATTPLPEVKVTVQGEEIMRA